MKIIKTNRKADRICVRYGTRLACGVWVIKNAALLTGLMAEMKENGFPCEILDLTGVSLLV